MLVAERYLEVVDIFSETLEAEVAGFDDARMDRAYGDFVDGCPIELEVCRDGWFYRGVGGALTSC